MLGLGLELGTQVLVNNTGDEERVLRGGRIFTADSV